ncbi:MAG: hypothetical protein ACFFDI_14990 [Promethearchaeota archaeon]
MTRNEQPTFRFMFVTLESDSRINEELSIDFQYVERCFRNINDAVGIIMRGLHDKYGQEITKGE